MVMTRVTVVMVMMMVVEKITMMMEEGVMLPPMVTLWVAVVAVVGVKMMKRMEMQLLDQKQGDSREKGVQSTEVPPRDSYRPHPAGPGCREPALPSQPGRGSGPCCVPA